MEQEELSRLLLGEATELGICDGWRRGWSGNATKQELVNKFLRGIDFCLRNKWPSPRFIAENFDSALLFKNGILANGRHSFLNPPVCVALGDSSATIRIDGGNASRIYVNDKSRTMLAVNSTGKVIVEVRGEAYLDVTASDRLPCDVIIYDYSDKSVVTAPSSVRYEKGADYLFG